MMADIHSLISLEAFKHSKALAFIINHVFCGTKECLSDLSFFRFHLYYIHMFLLSKNFPEYYHLEGTVEIENNIITEKLVVKLINCKYRKLKIEKIENCTISIPKGDSYCRRTDQRQGTSVKSLIRRTISIN